MVTARNPFLRLLRRLPFTLLLLLVLAAAALWTDTHSERISPGFLRRFGYAPRDLWLWNWAPLLTSALVTHGRQAFWGALGMVLLGVGAAEWRTSSGRTAATFWGVHLLTLLLESGGALASDQAGWMATATLRVRDVGPSAGYFGCIGLALTTLRKPWRELTGVLILAGLVVVFFLPPRAGQSLAVKRFADAAHLIAFPLGWLSAGLSRNQA